MKPIIVTASTMLELSELIAGTSAVAVPHVGHLQVYRARYCDRDLVIAATGIGKVNAACATTLLLERFGAKMLINTGCGGAFPGCGLGIGDLAVAQSESFADEGVQTPNGWHSLELIGIPVFQEGGRRFFNTFPLDPDLARGAGERALELGFAAVSGPFLTVSTCSGSADQGEELLRRFQGVCENMEGGAVAQVALQYAVPLLEVRGISNLVEDRDLARWDLKLAVSRAQSFLLSYLEHPKL
ncbi:futalosine hydrolase [Geoanaerobacter pelophilus]|uniref:Futalosine hydrolase n=1 Tax=Geoanaerobacter pelophilus TaxID=60036 RepID=A0ABQ0MKT5_9BACT|nr:futalosine hydrolase [Geoanaerobacter pelophilus]GAW67697.1 futalosine hydrolase [Geoanaerobacter pelophilus]